MSGFTEIGRSLKELNASALAAAHQATNGAIMSTAEEFEDREDREPRDNSDSQSLQHSQQTGSTINKAALCRQVLRQLGTKRYSNREIAEYIRQNYGVEVRPFNISNAKASLKKAKLRKVPIRTQLPRGLKHGLKNGNGGSYANPNLPESWGQVNTDYRPQGDQQAQNVSGFVSVQTASDGVLTEQDLVAARDFSRAVGGDVVRALRALQFYTNLVGQDN